MLQRRLDLLAAFMDVVAPVGFAGTVAPYRPRPTRIALRTSDDMDMQLSYDIAERPRIDLGAAGHVLQGLRHHDGFERHHRLVERRQIVDLLDAWTLRHQHQPGPAAVVHQP